ncbi:MAG TPA: hypothetical protein VJM33_17975, partial [Microthrixaceae bacterium]|nr:hypothetical protein [Microthrixaceae bacterium]
MTVTNTSTGVPSWEFELAVEAEADGIATAEQLDLLDAERLRWRDQLRHLLRDTEDALRAERSGTGGGSHQVIVDLESERRRLSSAWARLTGEGDEDDDEPAETAADAAPEIEIDDEVAGAQVTQIQLSWEPGRVVAWAAGHQAPIGDEAELVSLLERTGAPSTGWVRHGDISPPGGGNAPAMAIPVGDVLGWLVAVGAGQPEFDDPATPE